MPRFRRPCSHSSRLWACALVLLSTLFSAASCAAETDREAPAEPKLSLSDCSLPRHDRPGRCGTLTVPENPQLPDGRQIDLRIAVIPAREADPAPDPVFYLVGGPGSGAVSSARVFGDGFSRVRARRDVVLVDVRGTGESNPLTCPFPTLSAHLDAFLGSKVEPDLLAACLAELDADPAQYTTPRIADDLEAVRQALGYDRINLLAASYGTRLALVYLRRHPDSVRTVALRAVAPPTKRLHIDSFASAERTLQEALDRCASDDSCAADHPDLAQRLDALLERLDETPVTVPLPVGGGQTESLTIHREMLAGGLFLTLYDARAARRVPQVIAAADQGDWAPFLQAAGGAAAGLRRLAVGAYLSVLCAEDVPFASPAEVAATEGSRRGRPAMERITGLCDSWPHGSVPPSFKQPVQSEAPVLLLSGSLDPVTPPALAEAATRHLPNSAHVVVDDLGHVPTWTSCFTDLVGQLVETGAVEGLDTSCASES